MTSAVDPRGSWPRARGRFPDVLKRAQYGTLWDDHVVLELRPHEDLSEGSQHGMFRFDVNPTGTLADWYVSPKSGKRFEWDAQAKIRSHVSDERWNPEYQIPFEPMRYRSDDQKNKAGEPRTRVPPEPGMVVRSWVARAIGGTSPYFNAMGAHKWNTTKMKWILDPEAPSFQINDLGPIMKDRINVDLLLRRH